MLAEDDGGDDARSWYSSHSCLLMLIFQVLKILDGKKKRQSRELQVATQSQIPIHIHIYMHGCDNDECSGIGPVLLTQMSLKAYLMLMQQMLHSIQNIFHIF